MLISGYSWIVWQNLRKAVVCKSKKLGWEKWHIIKYGTRLTCLPVRMECLVQDWQNAAAWTQRHSIKANGFQNMNNRGGHLHSAYQKYCLRPGPVPKISLNSSPMIRNQNTTTKRHLKSPIGQIKPRRIWYQNPRFPHNGETAGSTRPTDIRINS